MPKHQKIVYQKIAALFVSILVLALSLFGIAAYQSVIQFPDRGLESAIRDNLARPDGLLTRNDLRKITHLDASGRNITRLEGMAHLRRLVVLNLKDNQVNDLSPLRNLNRLTDLDLRNNGIVDLKSVNFRALSGLRLTRLSLRHNVVRSDSGGQVRLTDISLLAPLTSLEILELRDNHVADITPLSNMVNLQTLDLRENRISDIGPLKHLVQLQYVNLRGNRIQDLDALTRLTALTYLNIHSNPHIRSIQPLLELTRLQTLIMRHVPVGNQVRILQEMPSLQRLNIRNCHVTDISLLSSLLNGKGLQNAPPPENGGVNTVRINEVMAINSSTLADEDGEYTDWIELYNYGNQPVDMSGWGLSDRPDSPFKWVFPEKSIIKADEYLLVWASGKNRTDEHLHTNFSISGSGEPIVLTAVDGTRVHDILPVAIPADMSMGFPREAHTELTFYDQPTPAAANTTPAKASILDPVQFSHTGGFYTEAFDLMLFHSDPEVTIVYTLDGSEPNISNLDGTVYRYKNSYSENPGDPFGPFLEQSYTSHVYRTPVAVYNRSAEADKLTRMSSTNHLTPDYFPDTPVRKAIVVRARAYKEGGIRSQTATHTYFVLPKGNPYHLPVISITIPEKFLFEYDEGIYTAGAVWDHWRAEHPAIHNEWAHPANFFRSGRHWEYACNVEIYNSGFVLSALNQSAGFRIHGGTSRAHAIKNLRLYARHHYDRHHYFRNEFFDTRVPFSHNPKNDVFKRLLLRRAGGGGPPFKDIVFNRLMQPVYKGVARIQPAILFMNGEYWGLTNIYDRMDQHHYGNHYGIDPDNIIIIGYERGYFTHEAGLSSDQAVFFDSMKHFILSNDMADDRHFKKAENMLDMRSFADHLILNMYSGNTHYEPTFWRARIPSDDHFGDGRWRVSVKDFDDTLYTPSRITGIFQTDSVFLGSSKFYISLLNNASFKNYFINRFADHINTTFDPARFRSIVDVTFGEVAGCLDEDYHRSQQRLFTLREKAHLIHWGKEHPKRQRQHIIEYFDLSGQYIITLDVSSSRHGHIKINTLDIMQSNPVLPSNSNPYPWRGIYFNDIPIRVEAVPADGYAFSHWKGLPEGLSADAAFLFLSPEGDMSLKAHFIRPRAFHRVPDKDIRRPPVVIRSIELQQLFEMSEPFQLDLTDVFYDADSTSLYYTATSTADDLVELGLRQNILTVSPLKRGASEITITADDGHNVPVSSSFRVRIYPKAHSVIASWDSRIYRYDLSVGEWKLWKQWRPFGATRIATADLDGDGADDFIGVFDDGVWAWLSAIENWNHVSPFVPDSIAAGELSGSSRTDVIAGWKDHGIHYLNTLGDGDWKQILQQFSPDAIEMGDIDGAGRQAVVASWKNYGIWAYQASGAWKPITSAGTPVFTLANTSGGSKSDIVGSWPAHGIFLLTDPATQMFRQFSDQHADILTSGDLNGDGRDEIVALIGDCIRVYYVADDRWETISDCSRGRPVDMITMRFR